MLKNKKTWIWIGAAAVVVVVLALIFGHKGKQQLRLTTEAVAQGSIENTVTATGEIQPVYKVEVGTQVSGIVKKLYVDYNSQVKKGELLAELDKSTLNEQLKQSKANLSTAQSSKDLAQKSFDRISKLYESKAATQEEYEQAEASLEQAKNQLTTAKSNYENAQTNLKYAEIYSPIDGVVLSKSVEEGQTVASSFSTPTIFTIANDLTQMQVEADVDEADIGQVKVGQNVTFTVDAFPNDVFNGTVKQIRLEPTVTSNVVTYTVIINAPNPDNKLYPGMTANVSIITSQQEGLVIPMEATYLTLTPDMQAQLKKEGYSIDALKGTHPEAHNHVWVVNGKSIVQRELTWGIDNGASVIVTSGLNEGEQVLLNLTTEMPSKGGGREAKDNPLSMGPPERKQR